MPSATLRASIALACCALLAGCEDLVYFPQPLPRGAHEAITARFPRVESLRLVRPDGVSLRGWLARGAGTSPRPLALYFGGNAEEVSWMLERREAFAGWDLALVNYRGYGASEGHPRETDLYGDALAVYDELATRADVDRGRIVAIGRSLGSGVVTYLATQRPLAGMVLISPFDSITAIGQRHYPFIPVRFVMGNLYDSLARAPGIRVPLLVVTGERDTIIPAAHSARLFEAWGGPKQAVVIPGAGHNDLQESPRFWSAIGGFLATLR
jgi:pimeloyl-ACP methyl ester carboxylesterase